MALPGMRIGLLGGSFNPAHEAHRRISLEALKRLGLDQVWWLVSPANPLKDPSDLRGFGERMAEAQVVADHPRIVVSDLEAQRGLAFTADTLRFLKGRYPGTHFVLLVGADNFAELHRWNDWRELFALAPIAVLDRPGWRLKARASKASHAFATAYRDESDSLSLPLARPPAWTQLSLPLSPLSSTSLREKGKAKAARGKRRQARKKR